VILTCPQCETSYFVDDGRIPPQGRKVRCTSCSHRWLAGPDGPLEDELADFDFEAEFEPTGEEEPAVVDAEPEVAPEPRPVRRIPTPAPKPDRSPALVWAGAAALAAALIAGVIVFREQVVRLWPASAVAYAGLGLEVAGSGLVLEQVRVEPAFLAGRPVLSVTGAIRNVRDVPVDAPPVRVTLLNRSGKPVEAKISRPVDATIPARARRHFAIAILDPPSTARDLEVRFDGQAKGRATAPVRSVAAAPAAVAPAAQPAEAVAAPHGGASQVEPLSPAAATEHG
jgi:predicted Zn finger-like uncharacterized protein